MFLSVFILTGCWDYQGLGEQAVVAGIAVDLGEEGRGYTLTFEIVDINGAQDGQFASILLTTSGETLVEAVYDAYAKLHGHVYLGVVDVVIVGRQVAEQVGLRPLVNYLIRDENARSSLRIVIAGTETAAELFGPVDQEEGAGGEKGPAQGQGQEIILSKVLGESLSPRRQGTSNATDVRAVYEIYHILNRGTSDLVLPIVGASEAEDIPFQLDGLALFIGDSMKGTLSEADMSTYLLATTGLRDRVLPVEMEGPTGERERRVLAVRHSRAEVRFVPEGGAVRFLVNVRVSADMLGLPEGSDVLDRATVRRIELAAERALSDQVLELAERLRDEGHDILGFATALRHHDPRLWEQIAGDWNARLRDSEIDVWVEVRKRRAA